MPQENTKARKAVRAAQKQFERESDAAHKARRKAFAQAQKEGLSLRAIGEEARSSVETMLARYTHATGGAFAEVRTIIS